MAHFTATVTGSGPISYAWDFGGAGSAAGEDTATPTFDYDAAGNYTVTLVVENACGTDEAAVTVEATEMRFFFPLAPRGYPPCAEKVMNGGFELDTGWEIPVTEYSAAYSSAAAHSGSRSARVGIVEPVENVFSFSSIQQAVEVPTDTVSATLRFYLFPISEAAATAGAPPAPPSVRSIMEADLSDDVQYVLILDEEDQQVGEPLVWQLSDSRQWALHTFDLSGAPYAGQTIKLVFGAHNDGLDGVTGMYVDDVSLEVCDHSP
jgi:PKD repeat protein